MFPLNSEMKGLSWGFMLILYILRWQNQGLSITRKGAGCSFAVGIHIEIQHSILDGIHNLKEILVMCLAKGGLTPREMRGRQGFCSHCVTINDTLYLNDCRYFSTHFSKRVLSLSLNHFLILKIFPYSLL